MANQRSHGTSFALFIAMRQLVLHGLPTTSTRTSDAAFFCDRLALADENLAVDPEQILALHAGLARHAANEQRPVTSRNTSSRSAVGTTPLRSGKAQSSQFHDHAFERGKRGRDFEQVKH